VTPDEYFALAQARGVRFRIRKAEEKRLAEETQKRAMEEAAARFAAQEAQGKDPGIPKQAVRRGARRKPRPAVGAIKKIEKDTGKTVVGATFAADGSVSVTFARSGEAAAETNPFEIEAARLRALKRGGK
jgi:hypothetical protein